MRSPPGSRRQSPMTAEKPGYKRWERTDVEYERLNGLGRVVFAAGTVVGMSAKLAKLTVRRMRVVAREAQQAFRAGLAEQEERRGE